MPSTPTVPLTINGGVIVAIGASDPEAAFDCGNNAFTITGGTFVGIGGSTSTPTKSLCTQNVIVKTSVSSAGSFSLQSSSGTTVFAYSIPSSCSAMVLSSPNIATSTTYTIYSGGTLPGDKEFYGLYLDDPSCSEGTAGRSFTVTSAVTIINS